MAELSITPVAPVTPAVQSASANTGSTPASGADATSQQASFAHVLKERSDANNAEQQSPPATPAKTDKSDAQAASDKAMAPPETAADIAGDVARLLANMTHGAKVSDATTTDDAKPDAKLDTGTQTVAEMLAGIAAKKAAQDKDKDKLPIDPTTQLNAAANVSAVIANPAVMTDKIASDAATIAAKTGQQDDLKTTLDSASSKTSSKQTFTLNTKPDTHSKPETATDSKLLATALSTTEAAAKTTADAASRAAADLASTPDASVTNRANGAALNTLTNAPSAQQQPSAVEHVISTSVGTRGWVEEVGQKLTWTANSDNGRASLVLTPPHMGRVEVSINVSGDQASASFVAASPAARDALQDAMPRLRELMAQAGINLGQTDVSAGQSGQPQADNRGTPGGGNHQSVSGIAAADSGITTGRSAWTQQGRGMIDTFA